MVTATRNGRKRAFTVKLWAEMPKDTYGWELVQVETPKEIQAPAVPAEMPERVTMTTNKKKRHAANKAHSNRENV